MINKILIVDDHEIVRQGLSLTIKDKYPILDVLEAGSLGRALTLLNQHNDIDIALVDIKLPGGDGRVLVPQIKEMIPSCKVIIISGSDDHDTVQSAIDAGANGFISKACSAPQMLEELELYAQGIMDFSESVTAVRHSDPSSLPEEPLQSFDFSKREMQIAELLQKGLSNKEISDQVFLSEGTVKNYMSQIFQKMQVTSRTQAVIKLNP